MIDRERAARRIAEIRRGIGASQADFADLLHVSAQAVSKWETAQSLPDIDLLLRIAWMGGTSVNAMLEGERYIDAVPGVDRGLLRLQRLLVCPTCGGAMALDARDAGDVRYACEDGHRIPVVDGVVDLRSREIEGELWSQGYRNYAEYLREHGPGNPNYLRGTGVDAHDAIWAEIERLRPRVILDMACGAGRGIERQIRRFHWPVTVIMIDVSHRILKWDRIYFSSECLNPYVEMAYVACDGAHLPIANDVIDMVFSYGGYESMQGKMMEGVREAHRVLRPGGSSVYTKSLIEDRDGANSRRWTKLLLDALEDGDFGVRDLLIDEAEWNARCRAAGFAPQTSERIYGELPAPQGDAFPFENEVAQWMALHVMRADKPKA